MAELCACFHVGALWMGRRDWGSIGEGFGCIMDDCVEGMECIYLAAS